MRDGASVGGGWDGFVVRGVRVRRRRRQHGDGRACPATYDELGLQYSWGKYAVANLYQNSDTTCSAANFYQHHAWPSGGACINFAGGVYGNATCSSSNVASYQLCTSNDCTTGCTTYTGNTCVAITEFAGFYGTFTCEQGVAPTTPAPTTAAPSAASTAHASAILVVASALAALVAAVIA